MTTDPQPCHGDSDCCTDLHRKADRFLELWEQRQAKTFAELKQSVLDRPRGCTLGDQFNDLIQRHDKLEISDAKFYEILADITGIRHPHDDQALQRFTGRELNAEEAREAEDAGLLVLECTAASDQEPVFLVDDARRRPEQGHIVNSPRFQAALEEFRQQHERGELRE